MLPYEKIDASKGIDINKTDVQKNCMGCHYWYFKNFGFIFKPHVCNKINAMMY